MHNERYYLLTGAAGFLGSNICAQLLREGKKVRALVLPNDKSVKFIPRKWKWSSVICATKLLWSPSLLCPKAAPA
jgi:nucleoside-diphosphate-sugar epimerase